MVVQSATMSTLNPNAPLFMAAEDFSPEWWRLVETCPAFRDYWPRERFESGDSYDVPTEEEDEYDAIDDLLDIADDLAHHKQDNASTLSVQVKDRFVVKQDREECDGKKLNDSSACDQRE